MVVELETLLPLRQILRHHRATSNTFDLLESGLRNFTMNNFLLSAWPHSAHRAEYRWAGQ